MAVNEMKKVALLALNEDMPKVILCLQRLGCLEIARAVDEHREQGRLAVLGERVERLDRAIELLRARPGQNSRRRIQRRKVGLEQVAGVLAAQGELLDATKQMEDIRNRHGALSGEQIALIERIEQLSPWEQMSTPLDELGDTRTAELFLAVLPRECGSALFEGARALGAVQWEMVFEGAEGIHVMLAAHESVLGPLEALLINCAAERVSFSGYRGTVALVLEQQRARLARIDAAGGLLDAEVSKYGGYLFEMMVLRDILALERDREQVMLQTVSTRRTRQLVGWTPQSGIEQLEAELRKCAPLCLLQVIEPDEGDCPPVEVGILKRIRAGRRHVFAPFRQDTRYVDIVQE